ncbi:hypothetical protein DAPPUDRAFT_331679 [Daphnia pulex]|uniref:Uncharacterized protein n=1 Tax=Daphnia pulex TaxID=6669 RepID=E9HN42_DAPPU|nr:hypothetical protein DAPPUDRAFT_331679 [Daphnia pulex]|eukprot:EFX66813.1 hypothetical protein DAPPUDRAFT_331679 [Daphnia pulex]
MDSFVEAKNESPKKMDQATNTLFRKETALVILIILNIVAAVCLANVIEKRYKQPLERITPDLDGANTTMTDTRTGATNQPTVVTIENDDLTLEEVEAILIKCGKIADRVTEEITEIYELIIEFEKQRKNE